MVTQTVLPFKLEKTNENLTAHAGLAVSHEFNLAVGTQRLLNAHLPSPGSNRGHKPAEWILPLILMLQGGGDDLTDINAIAEDTALWRACSLEKVPSESALGKLLLRTGVNGAAMKGLVEVYKVLTRMMLLEGTTTDFTLDADATIVAADKEDATIAYDGTKGFQSMLAFLDEYRWLIYDEFRQGKTAPAKGIIDVIKTAQARMPEGTRIARFRSDSAAYSHKIADYCHKQSIVFAIGADWDPAVKKLYKEFKPSDWGQFTTSSGRRREVAEAVHTFNEGTYSYRLIFVRDYDPQGNLFAEEIRGRAILTNYSEEVSGEDIIEWYNSRGKAENYIKELKHGFALRRVPCGTLEANAAWSRIAGLAYNLFLMQQALGLPEEFANSSVKTIRWRLCQVAGRLVSHGRRLFLKVCVASDVLQILENIRRVAHRLATDYGFT
jgi:hypothetical protein